MTRAALLPRLPSPPRAHTSASEIVITSRNASAQENSPLDCEMKHRERSPIPRFLSPSLNSHPDQKGTDTAGAREGDVSADKRKEAANVETADLLRSAPRIASRISPTANMTLTLGLEYSVVGAEGSVPLKILSRFLLAGVRFYVHACIHTQ